LIKRKLAAENLPPRGGEFDCGHTLPPEFFEPVEHGRTLIRLAESEQHNLLRGLHELRELARKGESKLEKGICSAYGFHSAVGISPNDFSQPVVPGRQKAGALTIIRIIRLIRWPTRCFAYFAMCSHGSR
jgi:hypothetical protein